MPVAEIDEYLSQELKRAGYSKVEMAKTPLGTRVVIYASKPGLVIGRRGQSIRDLTKILEERFGVENPQISVATLEIPELDPKVVVSDSHGVAAWNSLSTCSLLGPATNH